MSTKNFLNKNSSVVQSLMDFVSDTKPFRSKLTSVIEEYQFFDNVNVKIKERMLTRAKLDSTWLYNYYSSGNQITKTIPVKRVVTPSFFTTIHNVGTDEDKDLALVPLAYSKKTFDNVGINTAFIRRANGSVEPLTESVDYFQSHGSYQFQIKQTDNANGVFAPQYSSAMDDGIIGDAIRHTRELALDTNNLNSAVNQIRVALNEIKVLNDASGTNINVKRELDSLYAILNVPNLPQSYESLFAYTSIYLNIDEEAYRDRVERLSSPLFFGQYGDIGIRESGSAQYDNVTSNWLNVTNIVPDLNETFEEWTLEAIDNNTSTWSVVGSETGFAGFLIGGQPFLSPSKVSFDTEALAQPAIGDIVTLSTHHKLAIKRGVPLETWNIIKVNPIAHTRPILKSTGYGNIQNLDNVVGLVTLIDPTLLSTNIILEARANGVTFDLTNTEDLNHQGVVTVGVDYNDGYIGFRINAGLNPFRLGDKFYIAVENLPPQAFDIDLGYGYDMDPYDNDNVKDEQGRTIGFYYDGRFTNYDPALLNLVVTQTAKNGRKFRMRAIPDGALIATIKKDGSGPSANVDLTDATSGTAPDPALAAAPIYSMSGDGNPSPDIILYYSNNFQIEYSDNDFVTKTSIGTVPVGGHFTSAQYGISFDLTEGTKPFIAASSDDGAARVEGGDIFSFRVKNPLPTLSVKPIGLTSSHIPRLLMHSDSFFYAPAAHWSVVFTTPTSYTVTAIGAEEQEGVALYSTNGVIPTTGVQERENFSYKDDNIHFTIVPNAGLFAGDVFTFDTFGEKPEYLVHGSVTGFTKPATVGKYYWNGKIGFKIAKPDWEVYVPSTKTVPNYSVTPPTTKNIIVENILATAPITVNRLRNDCPSLSYILKKTIGGAGSGYLINNSDGYLVGATDLSVDTGVGTIFAGDRVTINSQSYVVSKALTNQIVISEPGLRGVVADDAAVTIAPGYMVSRTDVGVLGFVLATGVFFDKYISFSLNNATEPELRLDINAHDYTLFNGADVIIVKPPIEIQKPQLGDKVVIEKTENATFQISMTPGQVNLSALSPITIDQRFIDLDTGSGGTPLYSTSPETSILAGWLPTYVTHYDSSSIAEFSDPAIRHVYRSASNGQVIGEIRQQGANINEPILFEWDTAFFNSYLPLNAEANVVVSGTGWNDRFRAHISESVKFLIGGGALLEDWLFQDDIVVNFLEDKQSQILMTPSGELSVDVNDGPFTGFIPGYGNIGYDDEQGGYDEGQPPDLYSLLANANANLTIQSVADIYAQWNNFLESATAPTTEAQWAFLRNAIALDPNPGLGVTTGFGLPARGFGLDIVNSPVNSAAATIQEAMVVLAKYAANAHDINPYGVGYLDLLGNETAILLYTGLLPPVSPSIPVNVTYDSFNAPLTVGVPSRIFEISFNGTPSELAALTPTFKIWLPGYADPQDVISNVVEKVSAGKYSFSIPQASEAKIIVG